MSEQSPPDSSLGVGGERSGSLDPRQAYACTPAIDIRNGRTRQQLEETRGRRRGAEGLVNAQQGAADAALGVHDGPELRQVDQFLLVDPKRSSMDPQELGMRLLYFRDLAGDCEQTHVLAHALSMERERHHDDVIDAALSLKTCDRLE